jgi:phage/plasmid-like protein (TIGR03299 family)
MGTETTRQDTMRIWRKKAWWQTTDESLTASNGDLAFYPLADFPQGIPFANVKSLFDTAEAVAVPLEATLNDIPNGTRRIVDTSRAVHLNKHTGHVYTVGSDTRAIHQYSDWLAMDVEQVGLPIGFAGLFDGGGKAAVQYDLQAADTVVEEVGAIIRPFLLAATAHDASMSTTYRLVCQLVVCENTFGMAMGESLHGIKIRHTAHSEARAAEIGAAVADLAGVPAAVGEHISLMAQTTVTPRQWAKFLDLAVPMPEPVSAEKPGRARTMAENKRDALETLWASDERVAPWAGTKFGVLQAVDTFQRHVQGVRGVDRADRIVLSTLSGEFDKVDLELMKLLDGVLADA